jgi:phosphoribosyl 1,2-cyclic phosphodiesterase
MVFSFHVNGLNRFYELQDLYVCYYIIIWVATTDKSFAIIRGCFGDDFGHIVTDWQIRSYLGGIDGKIGV